MRTPGFEPTKIPLSPLQPEILPERPLIRPRITEQMWEDNTPRQSFHRGPVRKRKGYVLIAFSWVAAFIDTLFLVGMSLLFLAAFSLIMRHSLHVVMPRDPRLWIFSGAMVFLFLANAYMIVFRSFLGFTLGEWACSLRLGSPVERQSKFYSLKVIVRMMVIVMSGFVTLPLLGLLTGKDLAGSLSGVRLISLK